MSAFSKPTTQASTASRPRTIATGGMLTLAGFILVLLLLTGLPYAYGYLSATQGRVFQGIAFNVADIVQYWSWLRDHRSALLVPNRMTPEPNDPALFNSLWLVLGQVQVLTGLSSPAIYQVLRVVGGTAFLLALWWFVGVFTREPRRRWMAYLIATIGGGLGWVWVVDKYLNRLPDVRYPFDVYVAEPNGFFALLALPHLLVAAAMIAGIFGCFLLAERRGDQWQLYGLATFLALMLGLSHAYDLIMVYAVLSVYVLQQFVRARRILWGRFWGLAAVGCLSFPPAGYMTYLTTQNPLWREVLAQFDNAGVFTPNLLHIPILLGLPLIVTLLYGLTLVWRLARPAPAATELPMTVPAMASQDFLWVWAIVGFGLLYIPTDFQIKMLNPYQVPLALLTTQAVCGWLDRRRAASEQRPTAHANGVESVGRSSFVMHRSSLVVRHASLIVALFVLATLPTNLYLLGWRLIDLKRAEAPFYLSQGQVAAIEWLDSRSNERAVVLSGLEVGQYVPALTGQRGFLSHWAMTAQYFDKRDSVAQFFSLDTPAATRYNLLDRYQVRYILYGPEERRLGGFDPATDPRLRQVFQQADTAVFAVSP